jgi:ABC-type phosphate transport system substrate-binding protein
LLCPALAADLCVIVNLDNPVQALSAEQVSDLYLARARSFETGDQSDPVRAVILDQPETVPLRGEFYRALNGMSVNRVTAYWARLRFSGQVLPPEEVRNSQLMLEKVKSQRNAIGYVESEWVDRSVKVVLRLKR